MAGEMHANHKNEVSEQLRHKRIPATQIQRQFTPPAWLPLKTKQRVQTRDVTRLTRQLATLLQAGVPLLQAFAILDRDEHNASVKVVIRDVQTQLEGGVSLNTALRRHSEFDALYCNLVAEMLDAMLENLAQHLEKTEALRSALIYTCAVLAIEVALLALILVFVVPAFQTIFASFGAELPWLTRVVIGLCAPSAKSLARLTTCWRRKRSTMNAKSTTPSCDCLHS
jgi:type IV pilus assembly protein PilC